MVRRYGWSIVLVMLTGLTALSAGRIRELRPAPPELRAERTIEVVSGADAGAGTLREAIFAADRSDERVRIVLRPALIRLQAPLPPIVNPKGVVIESAGRTEIDARGIAIGSALEIAAPSTTLSRLTIRGARETAILVSAPSFLARDLAVLESGDGLGLLTGSGGAVVEASRFESNLVGIRVAADVTGVTIRNNAFRDHSDAGVWLSAGEPVTSDSPHVAIVGNRFAGDRIAIAVIHVPARIADNRISDALEVGIYLYGAASQVRSNQVIDGSTGILADATVGSVVESNELARLRNVGVLVRSSGRTIVRRNRVYSGSFGIAVIFGDGPGRDLVEGNLVVSNRYDALYLIGASPLIRENRLLRNGAAAARILDYAPWDGPAILSQPRFSGNVAQGNGFETEIRGVHRPPREESSR